MKARHGDKLTAKQARFVREYLIDLNACQAAIRAGYSAKTATVIGPRLLKKNRGVIEAVRKGQAKAEGNSEITQARVLAELALLAFSDVRHYLVNDSGDLQLAPGAPDAAWRAVSSVKHRTTTTGDGSDARTTHEVEFRLWDKPGAVKLAGRHVGLFPDKVEVTGDAGGPIKVTLNLADHDRS